MLLKKALQKIVITSLFSSLVIIFTFIKISIPLGNANTMIHLGNVVCLLSGLMLEPLYAGLAAGVGSFIFDLLNPLYCFSAPFNFVFKFIMAFICGLIYKSKIKNFKILIATSLSSIIYILLYGLKIFITNRYILKFSVELTLFLLLKGLTISIFNAILAILFSTLIYKSIYKRLENITN